VNLPESDELRDLNTTLIFERENWNRLYHEQGRKTVALEAALSDLLALAERLGQGLAPADPAVAVARELLGGIHRG
jgi:hypothetical protein